MPYLRADVELTLEREVQFADRHPELLPAYRDRIAETLADPDDVRRSQRFGNARLFSRWYTDIRGGKYVVVIVVGDLPHGRHWVISAYVARKLAPGVIEWQRS